MTRLWGRGSVSANAGVKLILQTIHLLKDFSHGGATRLLFGLHPTSGDDPLVWVPTAADQQHLEEAAQVGGVWKWIDGVRYWAFSLHPK